MISFVNHSRDEGGGLLLRAAGLTLSLISTSVNERERIITG